MEEKDLENNICLIGDIDITLIQENLDLFQDKYADKIENSWKIRIFKVKDEEEEKVKEVINEIIVSIKNIKTNFSNKIFSYTIIYSLYNFNTKKKSYLKSLLTEIAKMSSSFFYQPFLILLADDEKSKNSTISFLNEDSIQKLSIDKRNISCFISPLKGNKENIKMIKTKILKIFSYYYQLGDNITYKEHNFNLYKQNDKNLYSINVLVLGQSQVGKSTLINTLLKEKRAKEGGKGHSITTKMYAYHVDNIPLEIYDIEGFTGEKNINNVVKKISDMRDLLGEKELHIVIYVIDYGSNTFFNDNEFSIFKQLSEKYDFTQFLFVVTKSEEIVDDEKIEDIQRAFYKMINKGLNQNKNNDIINMLQYFYFCQKKDIYYEELKEEIKKL